MRSRWRRLTVLAMAALCTALLVGAGWRWRQAQADEQQRQRGAALFHGERPLVARLQGHAQGLPATAARCSNCHEALNPGPAAAGSAAGSRAPYAGVIRGHALTQPRPRRGGPPSAYDETRLCALLRTGIDPAHVMIPTTMPRYEPTPTDCADLWAYLRHEPD